MATRPLNDDDLEGFFDAQDHAERPKNKTIADVQKVLARANPVRWHRMRADARWLQHKLRKLGLNPEDWRYYL